MPLGEARILQVTLCNCSPIPSRIKETTMKWTKPECSDWRFGFEITLYIANR
ncbi:pyrroloquinoline quinone precursor peptide PqqA [Massilia sp. S19_KUP03_FR1]|uniref:pyrroloquinoline quinone precursor peptide PqqA n=1 Tax=Massilia sp. S19_KUP03_FR1 TaxID=3025503 RepID=UPI003FA564FA